MQALKGREEWHFTQVVAVDAQFMGDILTTFVETSPWSWYDWELNSLIRSVKMPWLEDHTVTQATFTIEEETHFIDFEMVAKGLRWVLDDLHSIIDPQAKSISRAVRDNDSGEIDAEGADIIVQYALFGELVYG